MPRMPHSCPRLARQWLRCSTRNPVSEFSISAAFDTLDPTARARGVREYETDAAINVTAKVRSELQTRDR